MSFLRIAWIRDKQMDRQSEENSKNRLGLCSLGGDVSKIETLDFCFAVMRYITVSFRIHPPPPPPPTIARLRGWPARQLSSVINQGLGSKLPLSPETFSESRELISVTYPWSHPSAGEKQGCNHQSKEWGLSHRYTHALLLPGWPQSPLSLKYSKEQPKTVSIFMDFDGEVGSLR